MKTFGEYLKESRGGAVYYWHREYNVSLKMLSDNEIRLTDSRFKGSEVLDKKRPFFMSMSRVPVNRWRKGMSGVLLKC